jgi:hypothetical protein
MLTPAPRKGINRYPPLVIPMLEKRTMTLNLSAHEMDVVERLADEKGLSKTALVRQALRLYQSISTRLDNGEKVFVEHPTTKEKAELMVLS